LISRKETPDPQRSETPADHYARWQRRSDDVAEQIDLGDAWQLRL
jgi:hypothetical protein